MPSIANFLIAGGVCLLVVGVLLALASRVFPGDIAVKRGDSAFYFPIVSSIVLSIVITIVLNIWQRFR